MLEGVASGGPVLVYLLLGLITRTRPLGDDVFLGLGIGRKGKGNAGKGSTLG